MAGLVLFVLGPRQIDSGQFVHIELTVQLTSIGRFCRQRFTCRELFKRGSNFFEAKMIFDPLATSNILGANMYEL